MRFRYQAFKLLTIFLAFTILNGCRLIGSTGSEIPNDSPPISDGTRGESPVDTGQQVVDNAYPFQMPTEEGFFGLMYGQSYRDERGYHSGIDILATGLTGVVWVDEENERGHPVYAVYDGISVGPTGSGLEICHPTLSNESWPDLPHYSVCTYYGHLKDLPKLFRDLPQNRCHPIAVAQGELLGYMDYDSEGNSVHLHFSIVKRNEETGCWRSTFDEEYILDPALYLGLPDNIIWGQDTSEMTDLMPSEVPYAIILEQSEFPIVQPGERFTITMRLVNMGFLPWESADYALRHVDGEQFSLPSARFLETTVDPGQDLTIILEGIAPQTPGSYQTVWQLIYQDSQGVIEPVSEEIRFLVTVIPAGTSPDLVGSLQQLIDQFMAEVEGNIRDYLDELQQEIEARIEAELRSRIPPWLQCLLGMGMILSNSWLVVFWRRKQGPDV